MSERLDAALASRGLARSRTQAAALLAEGAVRVDGVLVHKASTRVEAETLIEVVGADRAVSRGAHKLRAALDAFDINPAGRCALDMGASTGGFTQVLLERGAAEVMAVDVGHGQLAAELAADARVHQAEGFNVRDMTPERLAEETGCSRAPSLIVGDLSFIPLALVLPPTTAVLAESGDVVLLIKPQFEVGRSRIGNGVVNDPALRMDAVRGVLASAAEVGLGVCGLIRSPIAGGQGNIELLAHLVPGERTDPTQWEDTIAKEAG